MNLKNWLLTGDPVISKLAKRHLLDEFCPDEENGYIARYLELFDEKTRKWGGGVYSPKWISTHYTMMELKYLEIDPGNHKYHQGMHTLLERMWFNQGKVTKNRHQDMCVVAMMLAMAAYGKIQDDKVFEMIDYILAHQFLDGGWNCEWESSRKPTHSSLHTTLSVLEAFYYYLKNGYTFKKKEITKAIPLGEEFLLKKRLFLSERNGGVISDQMIQFHHPERWKYDCFRALEYFQAVKYPYDDRMKPAFELLFKKLKKGHVSRGTKYNGLIHFEIESDDLSRFNTIKALKIFKFYYPERFLAYLNSEIAL